MSYIEENLMNGESIVYRTKLHWVVFLWPIFFFVVAIVCFLLCPFNRGTGIDRAAAAYGGMFMLAAILKGIASFINFTTAEL